MGVKSQHERLEKVNKVVAQLLVNPKFVLHRDQLIEKGTSQQIVQVRFVFDILDQDACRLDYLNVNQAIVKG